ncbi:unnamed protein product [Cylicocyclus nassatus]|uniref:Receptor expression-enhancing protein n=1 Tax=Cylicocyclus nassatus TaxID=53992 RepID=A0AA36GVV1_CYLNA|nr:unnamed protein product [Cylicocyclus nassatus]
MENVVATQTQKEIGETKQSFEQFQRDAIGMATQLQQVCNTLQKRLQPVTEQMYDKDHNSAIENFLAAAEKRTNIKREKLVYGTVLAVIVYIIVGALSQILSNIAGFAYPAYRSVKAVRSPIKEDDTQWLIYWIVFAAFSIVDFSVFSSVPFYWSLKMGFLLYLYLPMFNGATVVYNNVIDPACTFVENYLSPNPSEPKKE